MLDRYLVAWFPMIARSFKKGLTYVDAFAGPGEYEGGEIGSPLLALKHAYRYEVVQARVPVRLVFIEKRKDRWRHLEALVEERYPQAKRPSTHQLLLRNGKCHDLLNPALTALGSWGSPMFVNFDGWGTDTPYKLVTQLGREEKSEVLITFSRSWPVRNRTRADDPHDLDGFFGEAKVWREIADQDDAKPALLTYYRQRLEQAGFQMSLVFELVDENGSELLLIFATKSEDGIVKMKDAMWKVDPVYGQRFRDPRDPNQLTFEIAEDADLTLLKRQLLERVSSLASVSLGDLKRHTLLDTIYKESHATTAVRALEGEMKVNVVWKQRHDDTIVQASILATADD